MNIIEFKKINKFFGQGDNRVHVLKNIDLTIEKGDFVAIIGQSGSGKSTMMNILGCLDVPTSGSYKINGVEVGKMEKDDVRSQLIYYAVDVIQRLKPEAWSHCQFFLSRYSQSEHWSQ